MKRHLMILLAITALCLLSACGAKEAPAVESTSAPNLSEETPPPPPEVPEVIHYTVSNSTREETVCTSEGVTLFTSRISLPVLSAYRADGSLITEGETEKETAALAAVQTFNEKFTDWTDENDFDGEDFAEIAAADYAWRIQEGIDWVGNYATDLDCTVYQTERIISVSGLYYSFTGGAHPNSVYLSWNFDLENGTFFGPELLGGAELQTAVTEELKRQCEIRAEESGLVPGELLWQDYETILADWQSYAITFDETGMTVTYSPYELAAYAAGAQIFQIPYAYLEPYLSTQGLAILGLADEPGA